MTGNFSIETQGTFRNPDLIIRLPSQSEALLTKLGYMGGKEELDKAILRILKYEEVIPKDFKLKLIEVNNPTNEWSILITITGTDESKHKITVDNMGVWKFLN